MHVHVAVLAVLAGAIAFGLAYRIVAPLFALGFWYVFLLDQANYLNHFYLIGLMIHDHGDRAGGEVRVQRCVAQAEYPL
ncbi:MAG: hypothetical protein ACI9W4_000677 [Rhodothermales bacterium]|jgi:hypothetical protein